MPLFDSRQFNWPKDGDLNAWADFAETLCMFSEDNLLTVDAFVDFLTDSGDKTTDQILRAVNFNEHFLDEVMPLPIPVPVEPEGDEDDEFGGDDEENEERERVQSRVLRLFQFLLSRQGYFKTSYPFVVTQGIHIKQHDQLTEIQRMYVLMLVFSQMHLYSRGDINRLGHRFEALCKLPFEYLLPVKAVKRFFGAGGGASMPSDYQGSLRERLIALSRDLRIKYKTAIDDPDEVGPGGDGGLDWVGWLPFEDEADHQPVYFGQCACGSNWIEKQNETSLQIWRNYLDLNQSLQCFHFMPRSFRRTSLEWFKTTVIHYELNLIDRFRLLKIFEQIDSDPFSEILDGFQDILDETEEFELDR